MKSNGDINIDVLISGCRKGTRKSQEQLYRLLAPQMFPVCISYARDTEGAKEIMQDAFIKVFRKINSFKGDGVFEGWVRRIVVNTALDYLRANKDLQYVKQMEDVESEVNVQNEALENIGSNELLTLTQRLPVGARAVFNLYAVEGYNHNEIAEKLSISVGTSKSQFSRARSLMKEWVTEIYG